MLYRFLFIRWFKAHKIFNFTFLFGFYFILLYFLLLPLFIFSDNFGAFLNFTNILYSCSSCFNDFRNLIWNFAWEILRILPTYDKFNIHWRLLLNWLFSFRGFRSFRLRALYFGNDFWCCSIYFILYIHACILNVSLLFDLFCLKLAGRFFEIGFCFSILMDLCIILVIFYVFFSKIANFLCGLWSSNFLFA
jgi:hypothetical protein